MRGAFVLVLALSAMGAAPAATRPEVYAVEIKKAEPGRDERFAAQEGVTVKVFVPQPERFIIGVDEKASKLTAFQDDKKTDLSKAKDPKAFKQDFLSPFNEVTKDGRGIKLDLRAPQPPAPGAKSIQIKANVALRVGSDEKKQEVKDVNLAESKVSLAGMNVTVKRAKDQAWGDYKMSVTINANRPQDGIRKLTFVGADGKEIKSGIISRSSFSFGTGGNWDVTYGLERVVEKATIRVEYFDKVEVVNVPMDMELGVGF
jgi:hypothetical protein